MIGKYTQCQSVKMPNMWFQGEKEGKDEVDEILDNAGNGDVVGIFFEFILETGIKVKNLLPCENKCEVFPKNGYLLISEKWVKLKIRLKDILARWPIPIKFISRNISIDYPYNRSGANN